MTTQPYRIRPGSLSDVPAAADIFIAAMTHDRLFEILYPNRDERPEVLAAQVHRLFYSRWWNPNFDLHVVLPAGRGAAAPVGLTWWKRPNSQLSFYERWVSPYAWIAPVVQAILSLRDWLFPIPHLDQHACNTFTRVIHDIEPGLLCTPRRKDAWYLSTLAVRPELQGKGLGTMLLRHGLQRADQCGAAAWLVGLKAVEGYYERHGFVEVARANVGEMKDWEGGAVMFRNE